MAESGEGSCEQQDEMYTIEASVVTGFEESARGEAKEKFGTDVKAARGKITFQVPLSRVTDVIKMGSIDNCRVVVHSVPYFKFTDQYDSLARLQKMVLNIDWKPGLKVWQCFYNFPHPIASKPDIIPDPEDMVDVVISKQPPPRSKEEKKNRKGGRGKKKEKKKNKGKGEETKEETKGDKEEGRAVDAEVSKSISNCQEENASGGTANKVSTHKDISGLASAAGDSSKVNVTDSGSKADDGVGDQISIEKKHESNIYAPKTVIIKRAVPGEEPKIDIRVIPEPTVFPSEVKENEERSLEPMDIDVSNLSISESMIHAKDGGGVSKVITDGKVVKDEEANRPCTDRELDATSATLHKNTKDDSESQMGSEQSGDAPEMLIVLADPKGDVKKVSSYEGSLTSFGRNLSEKEFASNVIQKLTSPPQSPVKQATSEIESPPSVSCVTPPPTPVAVLANPFTQERGLWSVGSPPLRDVIGQGLTGSSSPASQDNMGSSVDPPGYSLDPSTAVDESGEKESSSPANSVSVGPAVNVLSSPSTVSISNASESSGESPQKTLKDSECSSEEKSDTVLQLSPQKKERDLTKPTFRVTCNRIGDNHPFDSSSAAASLGSAIITYFNWSVDLKNFDIEVLLNIDNEEVTVSFALTKTSLHNRNLVAFGPTTLRATICYNMLRLCRIKNGDFVCDPMCGTSAIPIEGALNWVNCFHLGGDFHEKAIERTTLNMAAAEAKLKAENKNCAKIDAVQWDIEHFPLRDKCVDVFISDLPFGHRMGSRTVNRTLYPCVLSEMARTARSGARACLLTEDKTSLIKAIQSLSKYWQRRLVLSINIGGLAGFVFLLTRTTSEMAPMGKWREEQEPQKSGGVSESLSNEAQESGGDFENAASLGSEAAA